jgi:serine phosphatase RsbU (regulator of sigma subunit)
MEKRTTIFRQLILNIVLPAVLALLLLGVLNYQHTKNILVEANEEKNLIITDEIKSVHEMQDMTLDIIEEEIDPRMKAISHRLVEEYFAHSKNPEAEDLYKIREELGMEPDFEDIYLINRFGIVVNTTFANDRNLNLLNFGPEYKVLLESVFENKTFFSERFAIEDKTKRLKKFSYHPTLDGKYIVELGVYSHKADTVIQAVKNRINHLSTRQKNIVSVDLFIGKEKPFSLNKEAEIDQNHMGLYSNVLQTKGKTQVNERFGNKLLNYEYIYLGRKNTSLYSDSVIRIITDYSTERAFLRKELLKFFVIFGITTIVVVILLSRKTKVITDPIKKLVEKVNRISDGHLNERADVLGNNEIASLSEQFNVMIEQLESYYNELEQKVKDRTAEIQAQKEEIEAQRDSIQEQRNILSDINKSLQKAYLEIEEQKKHIEDSIHYARRIQNAILPPDDYVEKVIPDAFVYYKPKDIVSGDFYWVSQAGGKTVVAAVDCTGHGVPGAFMSIVGNNQLNYAINILGIDSPDEILNVLNEGVTRALRQTRISSSVKDGMDVALVTIDAENKKLQFAGAYNPLYLVKNNELVEIKADKFPVGGYVGEKLRKFTLHEFDVQRGDMVYIFSDGYADQFGGTDDSKFLVKRFRDLLFKIHEEPVAMQRDILNQIHEDWKGDSYQVDDILVIGIRL